MLRKDLLAKSLVWRFFIAIPIGMLITYYWVGSLVEALECSLFGNLIGTFLYYSYDVIWDKYFQKFFTTKE